MIRKLLALTCLSLSVCVNAALVDNITYVTDTVTGMDYLKLSQTHSAFWDEVVTNDSLGFISQGWSVTSHASLRALTDAYGNPAVQMIRDVAEINVITNADLHGGQNWLPQMVHYDTLTWKGLRRSGYSEGAHAWYTGWYREYAWYSVSLSRPSVVPIPAAGWLFMSALIGLIGKKRLSRR